MKLLEMPQPGSSKSWPLILLLAAPLAACGYGNDGHHYDDQSYGGGGYDVSPACGEAEEAVIDADQALDVDPGAGAGAFVEYESGGTYRITTSCDAAEAGDCYWDIVVTPLDGAPVLALSPIGLESDDTLSLAQQNSVRLVAYTGTDFDSFSIQTDPGTPLRFDGLLDNACGNRYLFWVGDGALHSGAPSNPIDLIPSAE